MLSFMAILRLLEMHDRPATQFSIFLAPWSGEPKSEPVGIVQTFSRSISRSSDSNVTIS